MAVSGELRWGKMTHAEAAVLERQLGFRHIRPGVDRLMENNPPRHQRRVSDDPEVARYDFLQEFQRIIDHATERLIAALETHKADPYAHQQMIAQARLSSAESQHRLVTLWDERNEMRGMVRVYLPVLGIVGPIISGIVVGVILFFILHR